MFPTELFTVIICNIDVSDRIHIYCGLLSFPQFARSLTSHKVLDFAILCGADVRVSTNELGHTCIQWTLNSELHSFCDLPAYAGHGIHLWYKRGKKHRSGDQPAIICADGKQEWWQHDELHRDGDQPAIVHADGTRQWWQHGKKHRDLTRGNIFQVVFSWYVYESISFRVILTTATTQQVVVCHLAITGRTSTANPNLPIRVAAVSIVSMSKTPT